MAEQSGLFVVPTNPFCCMHARNGLEYPEGRRSVTFIDLHRLTPQVQRALKNSALTLNLRRPAMQQVGFVAARRLHSTCGRGNILALGPHYAAFTSGEQGTAASAHARTHTHTLAFTRSESVIESTLPVSLEI